ncbi:TetR family transcriptional regulator C-terminal domain-containing protein [Tenacibaculum sp. SG-28]|uniref:TetR family transcriptional regulator C-terminal domain-containing protein n=1 Tax=Tenacibaculum sp. SG-28 TaxID=754426 RepID=UPI000CF4E30A|nr:TetR/AcrR family transcriptional regulator [Tenacibaculum sp. SG-28]PQJ23236.1 heat-shock protein [Tenacibaculum sp. SG-28]
MTRKKNITAEKIVDFYMNDVLLEHTPKSVYAFADKHNFNEGDFYQFFPSFDRLEQEIFALFCSNTVALLVKNEAYTTYDSKEKLLSFYYTFFEILTANRSYVYLKLKGNKNKLESLKLLQELKKEFSNYITAEIYKDGIDFKNKNINKLRDKSVLEVSWIQLLFTIQFWLEDVSKGFEKTDIFIEKSVKATFDLSDITPLQSVFDFAKFLWKEKMPTS